MTEGGAPRFGLVLGCADPDQLAEFWAGALDYVNVNAAGTYVALYPRDGNGPKLLLQRVDEPKRPRTECTWTSRPQTFALKPPASPHSEHDPSARHLAMSTAAPGS